ncbi:hypothetical protein ABH935_009312 [Catenulispora sp. GAS73]|uniref:hypothetical protein n=1 Tax=Catenulispora sp. GAS73 TaxID=3156269 RepID=UPI003514AAB6
MTRLRLIVQIPGRPNLDEAADTLYAGRTEALPEWITAIEKYDGFPIIDRTTTPLAITGAAEAFIVEAGIIFSNAATESTAG